MKKLMAMSFLFLGTFSMFANGDPVEEPKEDQAQLTVRCYRFEFVSTKWVNHNPTKYKTYHDEYGLYTEAGAAQRCQELSEMYPTDIDQNGNGYLTLQSCNTVDFSFCRGSISGMAE